MNYTLIVQDFICHLSVVTLCEDAARQQIGMKAAEAIESVLADALSPHLRPLSSRFPSTIDPIR